MLKLGRMLVGLGALCSIGIASADEALLKQKSAQVFIKQMVEQHHFKREDVVNVLKEAAYQPQIIEAMERPYEKKTWDVYRGLFLTPQRLDEGVKFWQENRETLARAERQYGVPASVIVAIIGVETLYGKHQGNYRVLDALSTLAFYYPKRSEFFTKELKEYMLLCREHHVPETLYKGSYAGAMGKPQFMPSSYRFYAVDFTGKGHSNLMENDEDVIGSVANYFHVHGWKMNEQVAVPVKMRGTRYKSLQTNSKYAEYEYKRMVKSGVMPALSFSKHPDKAGLIELTTNQGLSYWMAYPNFYVITRYNTSPQYALVVHLFSTQLQQRWASIKGKNARA